MSAFDVIILSITQGLTEWLPVSSSGHLVLLENILKVSDALAFDIFLHFASLIVIVIFFWPQIKAVARAALSRNRHTPYHNWLAYIVVSTIITGVVGYLMYDRIESFRNPAAVSSALIFTSILLLATKFAKRDKGINYWYAVWLGLIQALAILPGLSRSGAVISLALILGVGRRQAFEYSFLIAIPAIGGAFLLALPDFDFQMIYLLGFAITIIVGYLALLILKKIISRDNFYLFFIYTLALALIIKFA